MICKICNAEIDDNSKVCPFCGAEIEDAPQTSAFPDPAASAPSFEDPAAPAASFEDPAAPAASYENPEVSAPSFESTEAPAPSFESTEAPAPSFGSTEAPAPSFESTEAPAPSVENPAADLGLSEPAQPFADPAAQNPAYNAAAQNQGFTNPDPGFNAGQPNMGYSNPDPGFNSAPQNNGYGVPPQPNYGQPTPPPPMGGNYGGYTNMADPAADIEKQAGTIQTLGIVGLIVSIVVGFCCCALPGPIVGIVGLVKFNKIKDSLYMLTEAGQKKANTGKILCIVAIVLGALAIISNIVLMSTGALSNMMEELQ